MRDVTFSSQDVTFQIRCDADRFRKGFFQTFPGNCQIFLELAQFDNFVTWSHGRKQFAVDLCIFTSASCRAWRGCSRGGRGAGGGCGGVRWGNWIAV